MLPNLRFLICGVLFCFLLFAVTGAGVRLPDTRTRIGEMPEVGRPMMQRSMADATAQAQAQFYIMTAAHRADELERLREPQTQFGAAPAPAQMEPANPGTEPAKPAAETEPDLPKPAVMADAAPDSADADRAMAEDAEAPIQAPRAETAHNDQPGQAAGQQFAVLEPPSAEPSVAGSSEPVPRPANVPLPQPRPAFFGFHRRVHLLHRRHRIIIVQRDNLASGILVQSAPAQGASSQPAPAPGAVVQGWPASSVAASATATEAGKR
jgi:hypothetical protein